MALPAVWAVLQLCLLLLLRPVCSERPLSCSSRASGGLACSLPTDERGTVIPADFYELPAGAMPFSGAGATTTLKGNTEA